MRGVTQVPKRQVAADLPGYEAVHVTELPFAFLVCARCGGVVSFQQRTLHEQVIHADGMSSEVAAPS